MKYKITPQQLNILSQNTILIKESVFAINESTMKTYIVSLWVSSYSAEIRIGTHGGSGTAMEIARKLFPKARVYSAKSA